ncbi:ATP-dependent Clp protease proteolytic subunit [Aerophototrophica crusticola]|uniref:ATP-dependent Clp protease proteolytic subunit n=1 Tax=Aerophototrophica crusticola TaxID=1709002 RepID=UPI00384B0CA3
MRRLALALLLVLTAAAQTAGARAEQAALSAPPSLPSATVTQREGQDATVLRIDGVLTPEVAAKLDTAIARLPAGRPLLLELDSPGGYTNAGYAMIDRVMAEREAGRRVATAVRAGETCESMCVALYMAGAQRFAAPSSTFMVHAPGAWPPAR